MPKSRSKNKQTERLNVERINRQNINFIILITMPGRNENIIVKSYVPLIIGITLINHLLLI